MVLGYLEVAKTSPFGHFFAIFMGYNTLFWGPRLIQKARHIRFMVIWMSSIMVFSGRFGLFVC